jgi:peptidoglycan/xylan/chitin deacetylase (PgdA/CDA1 family)
MALGLHVPLVRAVSAAVDALAGPRLSIVIFHRVHAVPDPLFPHEMHAAQFDALCGELARCFRVMTLRDAMAARDAGRLPARALVITFDDGYADNATVASPILQRHGLPATFFVATGFLDGGRMFNDTVIEALRRTSATQVDAPALGLSACPLQTPLQRRAAIERALLVIKYMALPEREHALESLCSALGSPALPGDLMMRAEQVLQLHRAGMEIGGHTVRHPILRTLADGEARAEIRQGREQLQRIVGAPVESFAYPNGSPNQDYDTRHVAMVKEEGFRTAVSTAHGVVMPGADRYQLPRFSPWARNARLWIFRLVVARLRTISVAVSEPAAPALSSS